MKLLLDADLSWRLAVKLKSHFSDCLHVDSIELALPAKDIDIWNFAKKNNLIIITNDEDFLDLISLFGYPPKIILLRTGNQRNQYLFELILKHKGDIDILAASEDYGLMEIY